MTAPSKTVSAKPTTPKPASRAKVVRKIVWGAAALAVVGAVVVASRPKPLAVETAAVRAGVMRVTVDEVGKTRVRDRYVISAPLAGNVARIELEPGDTIKPGAVLARIAPMDAPMLDARTRAQSEARVLQAGAAQNQARAAVTRAELAREDAKRDAEQSRKLAKGGSMSAEAPDNAVLAERMRDAELASAKFAAQMADYEARQAAAMLARLAPGAAKEHVEVKSPIEGRVLRVLVESAGVVQPGTPLVEIGDPSALEVVTDVLTADAVTIPQRAPATVERWGGPPLKSNVRLVEPAAFSRVSALGVEEQRVHVVLDLDEPHELWSRLGDAFRVEVKIVTWEGADVVHVPSSAVFRRGERWAAFVVEGDRVSLREVDTGRRNGSEVEIVRGLAAGQRVVVHPSDRVTEGARVSTL